MTMLLCTCLLHFIIIILTVNYQNSKCEVQIGTQRIILMIFLFMPFTFPQIPSQISYETLRNAYLTQEDFKVVNMVSNCFILQFWFNF